MTFNIAIRLVTLLLVVLLVSLPAAVTGFGARRQYHSYHHLSQQSTKKKTKKNIKRTIHHSPSSSSLSETEMLLERAAKIRALSAQIRAVELASRLPSTVVKMRNKSAADRKEKGSDVLGS